MGREQKFSYFEQLSVVPIRSNKCSTITECTPILPPSLWKISHELSGPFIRIISLGRGSPVWYDFFSNRTMSAGFFAGFLRFPWNFQGISWIFWNWYRFVTAGTFEHFLGTSTFARGSQKFLEIFADWVFAIIFILEIFGPSEIVVELWGRQSKRQG